MDKELKRNMKIRIIKGSVIMAAIAILLSAVAIYFKICEVNAQENALNEKYMNQYQIDMSLLDFLSSKDKKIYKDKVIEACEAYDLKKLNKIVIDNDSIKLNKETNMYEWTIYCDDSKNTSFLCAYIKAKNDFTVERQYLNDIVTFDDIEKKNESNPKEENGSKATYTKGVYDRCKVNEYQYPNDCDMLQTDEQKELFASELGEYLGYNGIKETDRVTFKKYNEYNGKTYRNELIFNVDESAPEEIHELSAVYDNEWNFGILY